MEATLRQKDLLLYDRKFGIIMKTNLVLMQGKTKQQKIDLEAIEKVNLIKYRVLYTNLCLMAAAGALLFGAYWHWNPEQTGVLALLVTGVLLLVYAVTHKFYWYRLVITEKNAASHMVKTSQWNRKTIKKFYYTLIKNTFKKEQRSKL